MDYCYYLFFIWTMIFFLYMIIHFYYMFLSNPNEDIFIDILVAIFFSYTTIKTPPILLSLLFQLRLNWRVKNYRCFYALFLPFPWCCQLPYNIFHSFDEKKWTSNYTLMTLPFFLFYICDWKVNFRYT